MNGIWILLLLIITAALPAIIVYFWFRSRKSPVTLPWFLVSFTAGIVSLLAAVLIQNLFPPSGGGGLGQVFFGVFVRIALVEEASRLITLIPLLKAGNRRPGTDRTFGAALGLTAGLGFAAMENALYGTADIHITLLRIFSAAPLHGACGIRAGSAASIFRQHPVKALFLFLSAVLIHGAYNLMIVSPAVPSLLAVPTAFAAIFASLSSLKTSGEDDETPFSPKSPGP
ncbi:MAG: PrsW family glutamic-type intramembrane protease [Treponema sp.]|nr:PrsW family glutamic-type intramembrane protease [Treponema sp.]